MTRYLLKSLPGNAKAHGGFIWPTEPGSEVVCPDWDPEPRCGGGLHGALDGEGDGSLFCWTEGAIWIVAEIPKDAKVVDLSGKVKVNRCVVVYSGDREATTSWLRERLPKAAIIGGTATAGYKGTATAGYKGTATAGYKGTATAGHEGTATAGEYGTATAGDEGTATAGYRGTATAGYRGTATAGDEGTATAGDRGRATAGDWGTAIAGYRGTATAGYRGTATAGDEGTATAGDGGRATAGDGGRATAGDGGRATAGYRGRATAGNGGEIHVRYFDGTRSRTAVGYVGEQGIEPDTTYGVVAGKLVKVSP